MIGGMRLIPVAELQENEDREFAAQQASQHSEQTISQLSSFIQKCWEANKRTKQLVTERLLDCLRRRNGKYSSTQLAAINKAGGSEIYMMLTATKIRAGASWIRDILIPANARPWALTPANVPELPEYAVNLITQAIQKKAAELQAEGARISAQQMEAEVKRIEAKANENMKSKARQACDDMEEVIEDQLDQGNWIDSFESFIDDFSTFPAAFQKGPVYKKRPNVGWDSGKPVVTNKPIMMFEPVSPFDMYPSSDSTTVQDGSNLIEHVRFSRKSLYACRGVDGYDDDAIQRALEDYGNGGLKQWVWNEHERLSLEGKEHTFFSDDSSIDGLHYWGSAQGVTLLEWGVDPKLIDDPIGEYDIDAILVGRHAIRCVINRDPMGKRPYSKASFQNVPGSFWGIAIAELMGDLQDMCNATSRALQNNMAIASGPMGEVNNDRLQPGESPTDIYPWRMFQTKSSAVGANDPAIRFFQVSSNASELLAVYKDFEERADDATNIPRYAYGNQNVGGAGSTMGGLSMLMESANKGIKAAIGRIDRGVIRPTIQTMFYNNMLYHENQKIKFDAKVTATGSSSMIAREKNAVAKQNLLQLTSNPEDMRIIGPERRMLLIASIAKDSDLEGFVPNEKEVQDLMEQQSKQPDPKMEIEKAKLEQGSQSIQVKAETDKAKIMSNEKIKSMEINARDRAGGGGIPPRIANV